jgi:O-succinylhomoserine sulfhydrylase
MSTSMSDTPTFRPGTALIHGGIQRSHFGETAEALYLTSGFVYDNAEQAEATFRNEVERYQYSRFDNPTVAMLEARLAQIEGAEACRVMASGMAAVHGALFAHLKTGDRVVASRALFGGCFWIVSTLLPRFGIAFEFVDGPDLDQWRAALAKPTQLVLLETPSNPMLEIVDMAAIAELAHAAGAIVVVDNVFATPLLQKPLEFGADVVVYSCTKHIDGQGRVLGGCILATEKIMVDNYQQLLRQTGPSLSPFNAWVLLKGLETLSVRVARETEVAGKIADRLAGHDKLARLIYPGRKDHPQAAVIAKQMTGGSSLIALEIKGGKQGAFRFLNALSLIGITNNLGDSKSLITHPTTTTHQRLTPEQRADLGIGDGLVRLSVGLEHIDDLLDDLLGALEKV